VLKIAIVGCGKTADAYAQQIRYMEGCEIVGVCDHELLMAKQLYDRFPVKAYFSDLTELLVTVQPDVVHITTPPESHFDIARFCLENDCHVYIETPITPTANEAKQLVDLACRKRLKLTVGFNDQFSHVAWRMRKLVESGYLGENLVHMDSYCSYDLGSCTSKRALLENYGPNFPLQLLQNVMSHGIARIAEFLTSDNPHVIAFGFVSPFLEAMGEAEMVCELRVMILGDNRTTAYFTLSSRMKPSAREFRIYGSQNGLVLDQNHELLIQLRGVKFKSYVERLFLPVLFAKQHLGNLFENARLLLANDFRTDSGMRCLIESFYRSVRLDAPVPIPYREVLLTSRIIDGIFDQLRNTTGKSPTSIGPSERLVTYQ
jgi:predicted dehydrogenase